MTLPLRANLLQSFKGLSSYVWVLAGSMLINRTGSMVIAFMSLYLTKELDYSMGQAGIVMGAYGMGSIVGSYIGGWITDRKNVHNVLVYSLLVSGLLLLPLLYFKDFYAVTALIFFYSLVADSFRPANSVAVARFSTEETRTRSFTLMRLAINLGFGIGPALGGLVAVTIGFKWIFVIDALSSVMAAFIIWAYLPKNQLDPVKREEKKEGAAKTTVFADTEFLLFLLMVALFGSCFFQLFASVPVFFSRDFHYTEDVIGYLLGLNGLLVVIMEMPIIYRLEKSNNVYKYISFGCLSMALAYTLLWLNQPWIWLSVVYTFFITLAEILAMPFMMSFVFSRPVAERQGQYMAMYSVAYGLAHIAAPILGLKWADEFGFSLLYILATFLSIAIAIIFWLLFRKIGGKQLSA